MFENIHPLVITHDGFDVSILARSVRDAMANAKHAKDSAEAKLDAAMDAVYHAGF